MKRGTRILLFLGLLILILVAVAVYFFLQPQGAGVGATPTPGIEMVEIVTAGQPISRGSEIKTESLASMKIPADSWSESMILRQEDALGKYATFNLPQGIPLMVEMLSDRPDAGTGSTWARKIQPGQVAISIPMTRLGGVAYAIRDGDYINVIVTTMLVDLDGPYQSILPNNFGEILNVGASPGAATLMTLSNGGTGGPIGRAELDPVLNQAIYLLPSEAQRPRIVSQTLLQNVRVLHVGTFETTSAAAQQAQPAPATTPAAGQPAATPVPVIAPDVITLIVSPQDAVTLTYLMYGGAKLTLALRAPDDPSQTQTEAATLQNLLSQYAIPIPAKMPYGFQPRIDYLVEPILRNDIPTPRP
jgi:pilus assembly protein CpaB